MQNILCYRKYMLLFYTLIAGLSAAYAQTFEDARNLAFDGQREKARAVCRAILAQGFDSDVALLLGRTFAWDGKYDSTRVILNQVLARNPENMEALDAFADVEFWSENFTKAIAYCDMALKKDSTAESFVVKKAKILHSSDKFKEAVTTLETYIRTNPGHTEAIRKLQEYRIDVLKNSVRLSYTFDSFDKSFNRDPWQLIALSYSRKTSLGTIIVRANQARRFSNSGFQYEIDAYPKISENNYAYMNYGFSQSSVFPENRMGIEWYHSFPRAFEGSIGMRLLFFSSSTVDIYTAYLGKYVGNYWISIRSFVTPGNNGTSVSGLFLARRYFSDPENYLGLRLGYGVSPDDNLNLVDLDLKSRLSLNTRSVRLEFNHLFNRVWILNTGAVWGNEELQSGSFSNYYTFDISFSRLF